MKLNKRKRDGIYLLTTADGKRWSTGQRTLELAEQAAIRYLTIGDSKTDAKYTMDEALRDTHTNHWKHQLDSSKQYYINSISERLGCVPCVDISYRVLQSLVGQLRLEGLSTSTINKYLSTISKALNEAVALGRIENAPKIPRQKQAKRPKRYIKPHEIELLYSHLHLLDIDPERKQGGGKAKYEDMSTVMFHCLNVMLNTGVRPGELIKAAKFDINGDVWTLPDVKNNSPRSIPLNPIAFESLNALLAHETWIRITDRVNESPTRFRSARDFVSKAFAVLRDAIGIPELQIRLCRHTTATMLVKNGVDIYRAQKLLGHKTITTTESVYAELDVADLRESVDLLGARGKGKVVPIRGVK